MLTRIVHNSLKLDTIPETLIESFSELQQKRLRDLCDGLKMNIRRLLLP